jgi:hypothetical protein
MHQPNKLPNPHNSHPVTRGNGLRKQRTKKSLASNTPSSPLKTVGINHLEQQHKVQQLHSHAPAPVWLKSLLTAQRISMILFASVFGLSSIVYGYTMHTHTTWRTQQDQLSRWNNQERHQGVMNEKLKQDLAKKAETKESGLVAPKPEMSVFVRGASPRQLKSLPATAHTPTPIPAAKIPSGY